jgi:hypothetical protein
MALVNKMIKMFKDYVEKEIIDIPTMSKAQKKAIACELAGYLKDIITETVSESVVKMAEKNKR